MPVGPHSESDGADSRSTSQGRAPGCKRRGGRWRSRAAKEGRPALGRGGQGRRRKDGQRLKGRSRAAGMVLRWRVKERFQEGAGAVSRGCSRGCWPGLRHWSAGSSRRNARAALVTSDCGQHSGACWHRPQYSGPPMQPVVQRLGHLGRPCPHAATCTRGTSNSVVPCQFGRCAGGALPQVPGGIFGIEVVDLATSPGI